ncbi:alpha-ketoacid dehydrogenase subunit beta [Micromonospora sp. NPDC049051]|uniref:alpha-ketoacid dehydrogenase subunit beta n=1 Tax=Micromonospora sp. NPDC049051 TaxID=3364264 RepID=UPI0037109839
MRVAEDLNQALHALLTQNPNAWVLGEDIADPYGGAFKITKGLTSAFPERVLTTPISEAGIAGIAGGLALCGNSVVVEMMFADFLGLAFDQIVNFASKSVTMYGEVLPMRMVVRCPAGGRRGYGPTHSQSPQKHFIGVPNLSIHELSPLHPAAETLARMFATGAPALLVEDKTLYPSATITETQVDDLFSVRFLDGARNLAHVRVEGAGEPDAVIIAPGGMLDRALSAARRLLLETEQVCDIIVPAQLYPLDLGAAHELLAQTRLICFVEESTAGGTWGSEMANGLYRALWGRLRAPITLVHSLDSVIPAAAHLESQVLVRSDDIFRALTGGLDD